MNTDCNTQHLRERIAKLEAELQRSQQQLQAKQQQQEGLRQEILQKYGAELLELLEGGREVEVIVKDLFQRFQIEDEQDEVIFETEEIVVGKVIVLVLRN